MGYIDGIHGAPYIAAPWKLCVGEHQYPILISHEWFPASPSQDHPEHRDQRTGSLALAKSLACHEADGSGAKCDAELKPTIFKGIARW